ncbi:MAG: redox-sensing transcriptional repressor Rex [Clostridiales bacterium]|nr:redox-sensing transcriptional repressor Rex [Clostridiales bacterium]
MSSVRSERIPQGVIERLPAYLSVLLQLRAQGSETVSSARLGEVTDINPAQIRRDLTHFGQFGKRGVGYDVLTLIERIQAILGSDHAHRLVLVGAGHLGSAIAAYDGLRARGFTIVGVFDDDPAKIGARVGDYIVRDVTDLERTVREQAVRIGVIAVPAKSAQEVAARLVSAGVLVILNYSSAMISVPAHVTLHNTDPVRELLHTLYYLSQAESMAGSVAE